MQKKSATPARGSDLSRNCLGNDPVYLKGDEGSCYWMSTKGLRIHFCHACSAKDLCPGDIHSILTAVLSSVSSFDEEYVFRFSEALLSKIGDVRDMGCIPEATTDVFLGWKSIALLILSADRPVRTGIPVRIGPEEYDVFC